MNTNNTNHVYDDYSKHPGFAALKGHGSLNAEAKRELLSSLLPCKSIDMFPCWMLDENSEANAVFKVLKETGINEKSQKQHWNTAFSAKLIMQLYSLFQLARDGGQDKMSVKLHRPCKELKHFIKVVKPIIDAALARAEAAKSKRKHSAQTKQAPDALIQERVPFRPEGCLPQPCPACNHYFNMVVVDNKATQEAMVKEYNRQMETWNRTRGKNRGPEPKKPRFPDSEIACYCYSQNCMLNPDGKGCISCKSMGEENLSTIRGEDKNGLLTCFCEVCLCKCNVFFGRSKRAKVAAEALEKKEGIKGT